MTAPALPPGHCVACGDCVELYEVTCADCGRPACSPRCAQQHARGKIRDGSVGVVRCPCVALPLGVTIGGVAW